MDAEIHSPSLHMFLFTEGRLLDVAQLRLEESASTPGCLALWGTYFWQLITEWVFAQLTERKRRERGGSRVMCEPGGLIFQKAKSEVYLRNTEPFSIRPASLLRLTWNIKRGRRLIAQQSRNNSNCFFRLTAFRDGNISADIYENCVLSSGLKVSVILWSPSEHLCDDFWMRKHLVNNGLNLVGKWRFLLKVTHSCGLKKHGLVFFYIKK